MLNNVFVIPVRLLTFTSHFEVLKSVIEAHVESIRKAEMVLQEAIKTNSPEYIEIIESDQGDIVESLIGCSFVACQEFIEHVIARIRSLHQTAKTNSIVLKTTSAVKKDIRNKYSQRIENTDIGIIEATNAMANYFKHRNEWNTDWSKENGFAADTVSVIRQIGLNEGSNRNMAIGLDALGGDLLSLIRMIERWQGELNAAYVDELRKNKIEV